MKKFCEIGLVAIVAFGAIVLTGRVMSQTALPTLPTLQTMPLTVTEPLHVPVGPSVYHDPQLERMLDEIRNVPPPPPTPTYVPAPGVCYGKCALPPSWGTR